MSPKIAEYTIWSVGVPQLPLNVLICPYSTSSIALPGLRDKTEAQPIICEIGAGECHKSGMMHGGGLFRALLCPVLALSCLSPAVVSDVGPVRSVERSFFDTLPKELKLLIWDQLTLREYVATLGTFDGETWKRSRLPLEKELEKLSQARDIDLATHLIDVWASDVVFGGMEKDKERTAEGQRTKEAAQRTSLAMLVDKIYDNRKDWASNLVRERCRRALAENERLGSTEWESYADVAVGDIDAGNTETREAAIAKLAVLVRAAAMVGSTEVIRTIFSRAERAGVVGDLAVRDNDLLLWAVTHGHAAVVEYLFAKKEENPEWYGPIDLAANDNFAIRMAAQRRHVKVVRLLLAMKEARPEFYSGITPAAQDNYAVRMASANGNFDVVALLLTKKKDNPMLYADIDPAADYNYAIKHAAQNGHVHVVRLLLAKKEKNPELYKAIDPAAENNHALRLASENGHISVVTLLLEKKEEDIDNKFGYQGMNPAAHDNHAIKHAAQNGHIDVVRLLLKQKEERPDLYGGIDPAARDNYAVRMASENGHVDVIALLLEKKEENPELYWRIDPAAMNNYAIKNASKRGHSKVAEYLLAKKNEMPGLYRGISL